MKFFGPKVWRTIILCFITVSCSEAKGQKEYFNDLGEITFNEKLDDINFKVCHEDITLPFNFGRVGLVYEGEKKRLVKIIKSKFNYPETNGQTGFITIRFLINCEGKAGRFRMTEMGLDLNTKEFDKDISNQILGITKSLDGWKAFESNGNTWDYQQYLIFKIVDGKLKKILP